MKYFMYFVVITALIGVACAHPAAEDAAAASSAASAASSNGPSDAAAASDAAAKAGDAAKKGDPKDAITAMSKKGLNPLDFAAQITKFMNKIKEACEKFLKDIFGGSSGTGGSSADQKDASAAATGGASLAVAAKKDAALAASGGASVAVAANKVAASGANGAAFAKAAEEKAAAPIKASTGGENVVAAMEAAGSKALSDMFGSFGF